MSEIPAGSTIMVPQTLGLVLGLQEGEALWEEIQETYTTHLDFATSCYPQEPQKPNLTTLNHN